MAYRVGVIGAGAIGVEHARQRPPLYGPARRETP